MMFYFIEQNIVLLSRLNIYDTRSISCARCGKVIGEVDYDAEIIYPKCGQCSNPTPDIKDKMPYLIPH